MQLSKRKNAHFALLRLNNHHNKYMQNDYNLYDQECFIFHVLEETDPETQLQVEQLYINKYYDSQDLCYNAATNLTPEHIAKVAASHRGRKHTDEARKNMSLAHIGKGHKHTEETKKKLSEAHMGKPKPPLSDAHKAKLSAAHKGRPGKPLSEETKQKIRESVKTQYRFEGKYAKKAA